MKVCLHCKESIQRELFCKDRRNRDGLGPYCKNCKSELDRKRRTEHPEKARKWREDNPDYLIQWRRANPSKATEHARRYKAKNPEKVCAQRALNHAIHDGRVQRETTCSECGEAGKCEAHHEDYGKPLEVAWLCKKCHKKKHVIRRF